MSDAIRVGLTDADGKVDWVGFFIEQLQRLAGDVDEDLAKQLLPLVPFIAARHNLLADWGQDAVLDVIKAWHMEGQCAANELIAQQLMAPEVNAKQLLNNLRAGDLMTQYAARMNFVEGLIQRVLGGLVNFVGVKLGAGGV